MTLLRLICLLLIAGVLTLFTLQNWSASLQLVFLGIRSPAFPLPLWMLGAIAAGIVTTIVISMLFRLTRFTAQRSVRRTTSRTPVGQSSSYSYTPPVREAESPQTAWKGSSTPSRDEDWDDEDASDWFDDDSPDWTDEARDRPRQRTDYEVPQQPKSGSQSGSTYSYTYREPKRSDVVDADYRVIVPPSRNLDDEDSEKRD